MESKLFKRIYEEARQIYSPKQNITTKEEVSCALTYIAQSLQKIAYSISTERLQCSLDVFLPGTRLIESGIEDIDQANKNITLINQRINFFLEKNPTSFISGIDQIIAIVQRAVNTVNEAEREGEMTDSLQRSISVFDTILNVFNNLIEIIDDHNYTINNTYQLHNRVVR